MNQGIYRRKKFLSTEESLGHKITIGFAGIADFRSFIGQEYIAGMLKAAADYDINFINFAGAIKYSLFDDIDFFSHYSKKFKFMKSPLIDGLVTWASSFYEFIDDETIKKTFSSLKPLPMVDIGYLDLPGIPCVRIDNDFSMFLVMEHLIKHHGYKKFAFIGSKNSYPQCCRLECYYDGTTFCR